ncbi:D-glycero-beta-D-manno-heptose 1,7-bisphosphate 7-phosphatase [Vreelandella rituensis]|uniref:D,D-heptose 1,7-bisphosphate phosphatase n=1 Tax=Vreelandella rituensis TaxID=2282306 RepID=A0A368U637_9GAMM|nr:D-glycero-beta-D-manno-heptose 1,7-bisphosphate 7-phosphatase [Halomonas rituensis]RCV92444.1 D-glycero-beta-D-manno-heptose 1,7-bisphosphate 7-phosphatase [Halomonas rituensis]
MLSAQKLVILDRDGVINQDSDAYVKSLDEWVAYPSSIHAIARLSKAGFTVAVATNQSGISRGYYDIATLEAMHSRLHQLVGQAGGQIAYIAVCPHGPDDNCECRKPKPGLLDEIRHALQLETLEGSWIVGDSLRDLEAGESRGCQPVLVRTGKGTWTEAQGKGLGNTRVFENLEVFTDWLLSK